MRKKTKFLALTAVTGLTILFTACTKNPDMPGGPPVIPDDGSALYSLLTKECDFSAVLTEDEKAGLLHMREEEKLARDIYLAFSELYGVPVFSNIAASEEKHMDAVLFLIEGYGLTDPVAGKEPGVFTEAFQDLYDDLLAKGISGLEQAYVVGVTIEEQDIVDLKAYMEETEVTNILEVYSNLLKASEKHLKAFEKKQ